MANKDRPRGFRPHGDVKQIVLLESGSAVYAGEFVRIASDGQVDVVAAGETILGLALDTATASGTKIRVSCSPDQLYVGQGDETELSAQTIAGSNCDVLATAHNTTYKQSRMEIDSSDIKQSTAQLTLLGLNVASDNAFGANAEVIVKINEHQAFGADGFAGI